MGDLKTIKIEIIVKALTYLIGIIGFLSIYRYVNHVYSFAFILLFILSMFFEYKQKFYIPRWFLNTLSVLVVVFTIYKINTEELVTQIAQALLMIYAVKFLERKRVRDYMQIYTLTLFLLAGMGLLSLDILFSLFLIIIVVMLSTSFVLLTFYSQDPEMELTRQTAGRVVLKSLYIPCLAIPLTIVMFIILPRTQYPIFDFLNRADKAKTGFTNKVKLGAVSNIQEDSSIILRVNMERIDDNYLYWRGVVLDFFDGTSWSSTNKEVESQGASIVSSGKPVRQTIYLEPYANRYLFAMDKPVFIYMKGVKKLNNLTFKIPYFVERRLRYDALSIISDSHFESGIDRKTYLQLPDNISQDIKDLTSNIMRGEDGMKNILSLLSFFNSGSFRYSLKNLPVSRTPLDDFLFKNHYGNCEYFASACAVILRLAGIPARLVGGYRGGYYNDVGRYYLVPQRNAHVWVEAFVEGKGWIRLDPTPASVENFALIKKGSFILRMRLALDTINYYWYALVINYNLDRQLSIVFAVSSGIKRPVIQFERLRSKSWSYVKYLLGFLAMVIIVFLSIRQYKRRRNIEIILLQMFLRKMKNYGYEKKVSQGLEEFTRGIGDDRLREKALTFVRLFEGFFYRDIRLKKDDINKMRETIKNI
ncbi:MAG: DUF3488 domain-containing transglutaminase family protein [Syntrophorhabdales bacterium]|nr:DUF3488 domain-containing transglutaminase family protein [Syntrophorhabdales bacterium]